MKRFQTVPFKFAFLAAIIAGTCSIPVSARASVTFEFQMGAMPIPGNSLGVLVADTGGDGFTSPQQAAGTALVAGNAMGSGDDRIVAVFPITTGDPFAPGNGFAEFVGPVDYESLGVAEGEALIFYAFPVRSMGEEIRRGESFVSFRTDQSASIVGNMGFTLPEDGGSYVLGVFDPDFGGDTDFAEILPDTPLITVADPVDLIVGKDFELQLGGTGSPTLYLVRGLPPGLHYDRLTGLISGRLIRSGQFQFRVWIRNDAATSGPLTVSMDVAALPDEVVGNFQGLVAREAGLNESLGGKLALRTGRDGRLTGRLYLGGRSYGFRGELDADIVSGVPVDPTAAITINRRGLAPVEVDLTLDIDAETMAGSVGDGVDTTTVEGYHQGWHSRTNRPEAYEGYYTSLLDFDATQGLSGDAAVPQGNGFAALTVTRGGVARWQGRMADGASVSLAGILGPNGEYFVFRTLYRNTGSVLGTGMVISDPGNDGGYDDNTVDGLWDWLKQAQTSTRVRNYRDGFGVAEPVRQVVSGERYFPPARGEIPMGFPDQEGNASLLFSEGGLGDAEMNPNVVFQLTAGARGRMPTPGEVDNPARTSFSINRRTGLVSGAFLLQDTNPDSTTQPFFRRRGSYRGMILPSQRMGAGYFLLGQLPDDTVDPPTSMGTAPILSGQVVVEEPVP
ncbi:MAG: hypothetical protein H7A53_03000 [Akkermansiaceae bacterium]|nr:hypothetical protein [Akkermansiaceae bacterium]MCP5549852.1 hypothetical protein [Akkermansiaceae bacterium]